MHFTHIVERQNEKRGLESAFVSAGYANEIWMQILEEDGMAHKFWYLVMSECGAYLRYPWKHLATSLFL